MKAEQQGALSVDVELAIQEAMKKLNIRMTGAMLRVIEEASERIAKHAEVKVIK